MNKYLIVAGDPSGDIHAAKLIRSIKKLQPDSQFIGIGGSKMTAEGLKSIVDISDVSVVGFWEVAKKYVFFKKLLKQCVDILKNENIKAFIPVDYPGFNIRLAAHSKKLKIPVYYYIAPQLWAWGKNRSQKLAKVIDKLMVVFPFEVEYFSKFGIDVVFVGHPLMDNPEFNSPFKDFDSRKDEIAFFPGSRNQEVRRHLLLLKEILDCNETKSLNFQFVIAKSKNIEIGIFNDILKYKNVKISENSSEIMINSKAGIIKTGTSNLEAALCGLPFIMYYKTSFLTYKIASRLINLPYISIVNILADKMLIKEFIQKDAKPKLMIKQLEYILSNKDEYADIQNEFADLRTKLGVKGASDNAAKIILG